MISSSDIEPARLFPLRYPWAYEHLQQAKRNTWFPEEVSLADDVRDWNERLGEEEKRAVEIMLGFFNPMESLVTSNIVFAIYPYISAPEVRLYLIRQAWEEVNHTLAFEYVMKTLPIDRERIFKLHENNAEIAEKISFQKRFTENIVRHRVEPSGKYGKRSLIYNLIGYFMVLEGIFFYSGFAFFLSFRRRNLLKGLNTIIEWVIRDESLHLSFGTCLINQILIENNDIRTERFLRKIKQLIIEAVSKEERYNRSILPQPIIGISADILNEYVRYIADRRMRELGLKPHYKAENPLKWMAVEVDVPTVVNFFEAKNTSYEVGLGR